MSASDDEIEQLTERVDELWVAYKKLIKAATGEHQTVDTDLSDLDEALDYIAIAQGFRDQWQDELSIRGLEWPAQLKAYDEDAEAFLDAVEGVHGLARVLEREGIIPRATMLPAAELGDRLTE